VAWVPWAPFVYATVDKLTPRTGGLGMFIMFGPTGAMQVT